MENLSIIKVSLAYAGNTGIWLAGQLSKDPVTLSKWCPNTIQPDLQTLAKISDMQKSTLLICWSIVTCIIFLIKIKTK